LTLLGYNPNTFTEILMDYFLATDGHTLSIIGNGNTLAVTLKKHWLSKGVTRTQAALALIEFLSGVEFDRDQKSWRKLRRTVNREPDVAAILFNDPPTQDPIVHQKFFSLDNAAVEMWLREVFGVYRVHLPPYVASLQQDWECWTTERWSNTVISKSPKAQAAAAASVHQLIGAMVAEKAEAKARQLQEEATATLNAMVQQAQQAAWADQAQAGTANQVWSNIGRPSSGPVLAPTYNRHYDQG
jgi:hypothetical protein